MSTNTEPSDLPSLGTCCACRQAGPAVRNIMMLDKLSPIPGHGWGCVVCDLPPNGACYVLCDDCLESGAEPVEACRGYPGSDGRIPFAELTTEFKHDLSRHPECCEMDLGEDGL